MNIDTKILKSIIQQAIDNSEMSDYPKNESKSPCFLKSHLTKPMGKYIGFEIKEEKDDYFIYFKLGNYTNPVKKNLIEIIKEGVFFTSFWGVEKYSEIPICLKPTEDPEDFFTLYNYFKEYLSK